ncbi:RHS repeat-associated core domain protein [Rivularia sp. PCC 7116]|uniref:putative Ig domain-containing protein n=1 Tax=Rivularia sp. PCC 7116 TaxID=373994 RepID=UPI00029F49BC|nr:putative Ig domain-containing protein [Rivularia sp. PCC 7116]AFY54222.1 RHS repeat-associated core domain protein [Rivularia sp. PCC 7116]
MENLDFNQFNLSEQSDFYTVPNFSSLKPPFLLNIQNEQEFHPSLLDFGENINNSELPIYSFTSTPITAIPSSSVQDINSLPANLLLEDSFVVNAEAINFSLSSSSSDFDDSISQAILQVQNSLSQFLEKSDSLQQLQLAFGDTWEPETANGLIKDLKDNHNFPSIELIDSKQFSARGAFSAETNSIYLDKQFLEQNKSNINAISAVIEEEIGHYLDAKLNLTDSNGDEGKIFALLVQGVELTAEKIQQLKAENDWTILNINGQNLWVEQSSNEIVGTPGRDILQGTPEDDRIIGGFAGDIIFGNDGKDTFVYQTIRDAGDVIKDFEIQKDIIDFTGVLNSFGYSGLNPIGDGYIQFSSYATGTTILIDSDGTGGRLTARPYLKVEAVTAEQLSTYPAHFLPVDNLPQNQVPTDLFVIPANIPENAPGNSVIGTFNTVDSDVGDSHSYSLIAGEGDTDNNAFSIVDNELQINQSPNFETKSNYSILVRTTDQGGLFFDKSINITVSDVNEAPTVLNISNENIAENNLADAVIGTFTTTDVDISDSHTYNLINGEGDTDNNAFSIVDNQLQINDSTDFETQSNYSIRVQTIDAGGLSYEQIFSIAVSDVNEAPTVLNISNENIAENNLADAVIGTFTTTDADISDSHTYNLINGEGDKDNNAFTIVENQLQINDSTDFETQSNYSIRVQTIDAGGLSYEQIFSLSVTNVNEAPIITLPGEQSVDEFTSSTISGISIDDVDAGQNQFTVTIYSDNGTVGITPIQGVTVTETGRNLTLSGILADINTALTNLTYKGDPNFSGSDIITVIANDLGSTGTGGDNQVISTIPITVNSINLPPVADEDKLLTVQQNSDAISLGIAAPTDPDDDSLTITVEEIPAVDKGAVKLGDSLVIVGQSLTLAELAALVFVPVADTTGDAGQFSYIVDDGQGGSDSQTVNFNISPVIILREGEDFKVVREEEITIPATPSLLSFSYEALNFDTTDNNFINDAFEVALLDENGKTLVHTIGNNKDVFFNFTEEQSPLLAPGVTLEGQIINLDLSHIPSGTAATVVFRLVNNDSDTETSVIINNLEIIPNPTPGNTGAIPTITNSGSNSIDILQLSDVSASTKAQYQQTSFNEQRNILTAEVAIENTGSYGLNGRLIVAINQLSDPSIKVVNADGLTPDGLPYYDFTDLITGGNLDPGDLTKTKTITFANPNQIQFDYELVVLSEINENPIIKSNPNLEVIGGLNYVYDVNATDANGDTLTYELLISPEGMTIDADTGIITWNTAVADIANHQIFIQVSDGRGGFAQQDFTLATISAPPNRPPLFTSNPVVDAYINQLYQYDADAIDPDLDLLNYSLILGPEGMNINPNTGLIEWEPKPVFTLGDTVLGQLSIPGETDEFTFSGVIGQQIYFDPLQYGGNYWDWNFEVYSPSGKQIVSTNLQSSSNQLVTLTETGNYRIVVDADNDVTGNYGFSVIDLNLTPIAALDTVIEGQLSPGSEDDVYRFTGNAGQKLFFDRLNSSGNWNWLLYDPGNDVVASNSFSDMELYLPTDGEYKLVIRGTGNLTDITPYAFEIITPDEITTAITLGNNDNPNSVFGEITEKGEEDFYTFNGSVGQIIYFDRLFLDSTSSLSHTFTIISPSGDSVFSQNFNSNDSSTPIFLPENGTYRVRIDASGENTGSYSFNLLDVGLATAIDLDAEYSGTLDVGQETHLYQFEGIKGQRIFIDSPGVISGGTWTVYNSANKQIVNTSIGSDIEIVLDSTDTYILAIKGNNGTNQVDYNFQIITPDIITEPLVLDTDVVSEITEKGEQDIYTFTGSLGQRLFLDTLIDRWDFQATLISPSGEKIVNSIRMYFDGSNSTTPVILPEAGTYQLIIDGSGEATGEYGFSLIDVSAAPVLEVETLTAGVLDPGKSIQFYQFSGNKGDRIYFDNQANSSGATWYLFNTNSNRLRSASLGSDFEYVLSGDDTYYLMLSGESDTTVDYNIQIVNTTAVSTPMTLNGTVNGEIAKLGEQDIHTFAGTVGQTLYFDPRIANNNFTVTINSPSGQQVWSGNGSSDSIPVTLTEPGTYQLIVDGNNDNTGEYSFVLSDAASALVFDTALNGNLDARETVLYQFNGTGGQQLEFDSLSNVSGADWVIYAPTKLLNKSNKTVASSALSSDFKVTLPVDGSYILALRNNSDSNFSYQLQVNDVSTAPVISSDIETLREGSISVAGEIDTYNFTANAGTLIYFDGQQGGFNFYARLGNPDGTRISTSTLYTGSDSGAYLLTQTGDYSLEVVANGNNSTEDYRFKLVDLKASPVFDLNTPANVTINPLETKAFKFTGTVGQKLWFDGLNASNTNITVSLINSSGYQIASTSSLQNDIELKNLEADGEYYLVLQSNNTDVTTASFQVLDNINATFIDLDTEITGNFGDSKQQTHLYRFNATKGQKLYFDQIERDRYNYYYLYNPAGERLFSRQLLSDEEITLPTDGEYTLVFAGSNSASNNNYTLKIVTPEFTTTPLSMGETINDEIGEAGEEDTYTFEGTVGQKLWLDELLGNSNITATLYSPSGNQVFSSSFGNRDDSYWRPPILEETGTYKLVVDGSLDATQAYSFRLLDFADATPIDLDTEITGNFGDSNQQTHLYRFNGSKGQQLYFDQIEGDRYNYYYLYNPAGERLFSQFLDRDRQEITLPTDGEYTLVFAGDNSASNNNYALKIVTPEFTTTPLSMGETINDEIGEAGEEDTYNFEGTIGQKLWLDELLGNSNITATLYSPSDNQVFSSSFGNRDDSYWRPPILEETGTYKLVVDGSEDTTGAYSFRLLDFADATPIDLDTEITGNFGDSNQQTHLYRFNGSKGQQLYFDQIEGDRYNYYYLYNPAGERLFSQFLDRDRQEITLPTDGEYTLVFAGDNSASNNNYALKIVTPEFTTATLSIGETINGEISEAGEEDTYTFEGTIGQKLWLDELIGNSNIKATLYSPSGNQVFSSSFGNRDDSYLRPPVLEENGIYKLVVDGSLDATQAYSFRLLDFADATPIDLDTEITGNFGDSNQQTHLYRFNATKGQQLYFDQIEGDRYNYYYLYNPAGERLFSQFLDRDRQEITLPTDGEYTLAFAGDNSGSNNNYALKIVTSEFTTTPLTLGETISSEISELGEEDTYTFEGTVGQQLFFDSLVGNFNLDARLYSPSGNLIADLRTDLDGTPFTLTEAGNYRLVIDGNSDTVGNYSFRLSDRAQVTPLELSSAISGSLESGNEVDLYQITGTRGTILNFNLDAAAWSGANWVLYDPDNGILAQPSSNNPDFEVALPSDGLYTLAIVGNGTTAVNYSFQVTDNSVAPIPITGTNVTVSGTVANVGDVDSYTFAASAGTLIWLDQLSNTSSSILANLKNPDGSYVFENRGTDNDFGVIRLDQTGEYTIETFGASSSTTGNWQFQILELISDPRSSSFNPQPFNAVREDSLDSETSTKIYQIDAIVGQKLLFNGMRGDVNVDLINPNGEQVFNWNNFDSNNSIIPTLTQDGIYYLVISGNSGGNLDYAFQLINLASGPELPVNVPVSGNLASGQQSTLYQLTGKADQKLFFDIKDGSTSAQIKVYSPNHEDVLYSTFLDSSYSFELTLPEDGFYTVLIEGGSSTTSINYEFQVFAPNTDLVGIVTPGNGTRNDTDNTLGEFAVQIAVEDGQGGKTLQDFSINLLPDPDNNAPTIISTPQTRAALDREFYRYQLQSLDPDGDSLLYRLVEAPSGALIDNSTGELLWFLDESVAAGETYDFKVEVGDGRGGVDTQNFQVDVFSELGTIQGFAFDDLNQNGIFDLDLIQGDTPDVFFVIEYSCAVSGGVVDWTTADLETAFSGNLTPVDQELGAILLLNNYLIEQGFGETANIGILDGTGEVFDMDPSRPGIQVATNPLADNNNNGIADIREALRRPLYGSSPNAVVKAIDLHEGLGLTGDLNVMFMSSGNFTLKEEDTTAIDAAKAEGVNVSAFSFSLRAMEKMRAIDPEATLIKSTQQVYDIFSGNVLGENFDPKFIAEPLLENVTVYLDLNNNSVLDPEEPKQITKQPGENGNYYYSFDNLLPGDYTVRQVVPENYFETTPASGSFVDTVSATDNTFTHAFGIARKDNNSLVNQNPVFTSTPPTERLEVGEKFIYQALATDADLDSLTFDLSLAPEGMIVDAELGLVLWQPTQEQIGIPGTLLRVQDGEGGFATQYFELNVTPLNNAPVFTSIVPENATPQVGKPFQYQAQAIDPDGDRLTYELVNALSNITIDTATGLVNWTPDSTEIGDRQFQVKVSDGNGGEDVQELNFNVIETIPNNAPEITSNPPIKARANNLYVYQVGAEDIDGDPFSFNLNNAPDGMTIDERGRITWNPDVSQLGEHTVEVTVEDGQGGIASQSFNLNVSNRVANQAPSITSIPNTITNTERLYQYQPQATDPDNDYLLWNLDQAPQGLVIDSESGILSWQPKTNQIGSHNIAIRVTDTFGQAEIQTFELQVTGNNTPPAIISTPNTIAASTQLYSYQIAANDPENDPLRYSLGIRPQGMIVEESTGLIQWTPQTGQTGENTVEIFVEDTQGGISSQTYTLVVGTNAVNQAPTITSNPGFLADVENGYSYQIQATDPDNDPITFQLLSNPEGMTVDANTGLIQWSPQSGQIGNAQVSVAAFDDNGLGAIQTYTIKVQQSNSEPVINSNPIESAAPGITYRYDINANDPDGELLTYTLTQAPQGMEIDQLGRISWLAGNDNLGINPVEITVSDGRGATVTQTYDINVAADEIAPQIELILNQETVNIGDSVKVLISATDNVGVDTINLTFNGNPIALDAQNQATITVEQAGNFEILATAKDLAGNIGTATANAIGIDNSDVNPPVISITSLENGDVVTAITDIIGTVTDDNLVYYTLSLASQDGSFTEIFRGTDNITDDVLGKFDPSNLSNDSYTLRLSAVDAGGNQSVVDIAVEVAGELKVGNFQLSFTDLSIPVAGIPIILNRTYDTLNANSSDDFGYGWRMGIQDTDLRTSVAETGSEENLIYNPFFTGARVYVTTPGGKREGFTFKPQLAPGFKGSFLGMWEPVFVPDAGVTSELTVEHFDLSRTNTGDFTSFGSSLAYNPSNPAFGGTFTLATKEGVIYEIDGNSGDTKTVSDRNGNKLTFTDAGIISSSGQQITFERNSQGQITAAIDPSGQRIEYEYNTTGDLISVTDREGNVTRFDYDETRPHYLEEVIDPLGRSGVRSEYDDQGRLVKIIDADGIPVELIHNPDNFVETVKDQLGNETVFEYDNRGNVINQIDALGGLTERTYDENNNVLTETDPLGNTTTFIYDNRGNVLTETDALGSVTRFTYDSFGNVLTATDSQGNTTSNTYDRNGNLTSISGQANGTTNLNYDASGNLTSFGDANGTTTFEYDASGNVTRQIDTEGNETTFTYDANGNQLSETKTLTTPEGVITLTTTTEYDAEGRVTKVTDAQGGVTQTRYDAVGNQIEQIDALGRSTKFVYDERGLLVETIYADSTPEDDSDNSRTKTEYDAAGQVIAEIDELGRKTQFKYDKLGRVVETILPDSTPDDDSDNPSTKTEYDAAGQVIAEIDESGNRTQFVYDKAGRQIETILPDETPLDNSDNPRFTTTYNAAGRQISQTDAKGNVTEFLYDDLGRPVGQKFADGTTVNSQFDETGRLIARTDQDGEITRYEYDTSGRLTAVIDALEQRTEYDYNEQGNLVSQKDANGNITKFEYDSLGRRIATELPEGQRYTTEYDAIGNVIRTTDFNGESITYEYDDRNQLIAKNFPDGSTTTFTYTLNGQRETVVDEHGTTTYEYDAQNRLIKRIDADGTEIAYTYDAAGNRTAVNIPSGTSDYTFDELNRLQTVTDADGGITTYEYDNNSNLIRTQSANGTVENRVYDNLNRLTYIETKDINGDIISSFLYELDAEGNRTQVTEHNGRIVKYYYDDLDRLQKEEIFNPTATAATRTIEYTYDAVGNRLSRDDSGEGTTIYTYDNNDLLLSETTNGTETTYTYDNNGNTITKSTDGNTVTYNWDEENRLVGADTDGDGTVDVENQYDADGVRIAQTVNGEQTRFLIDNNRPYAQVLEEYTEGGIIKVSYVHGNDLISQERNGEKSFYHVDGLGSTRALSNESGNANDSYIYDAFGQVLTKIGDTENSYLYAGEQRDSNLGLDYLRARYLDVNSGRFVSRDSFEGNLLNPITLHKYQYTGNNPTNNIDPTGMFTIASMLSVSIPEVDFRVAYSKATIRGGVHASKTLLELLPQAMLLREKGLLAIANDISGGFELYQLGNEKFLEAIKQVPKAFRESFGAAAKTLLPSVKINIFTSGSLVSPLLTGIDRARRVNNKIKQLNNTAEQWSTRLEQYLGIPTPQSFKRLNTITKQFSQDIDAIIGEESISIGVVNINGAPNRGNLKSGITTAEDKVTIKLPPFIYRNRSR